MNSPAIRALIFVKQGPRLGHAIEVGGGYCNRMGYDVARIVVDDWDEAYRLVYDPDHQISEVLVVPDRSHLPDGVVPPPRTEVVSEEPDQPVTPPQPRQKPRRVGRVRRGDGG
jgi:hypothetical protein